MIWIKFLRKIIKILNSDVAPSQIAAGFALGSIIGLTPFSAFHNLFVFFLILILNVNIASAFLGIAIFGLIGIFTDPFAHKIGYYLLVQNESLTPVWTELYNLPLVPFTRFYNTIVLGSLSISLILYIPVYIIMKKFVIKYRKDFKQRVNNWKIMKWFKLSKIYGLYEKYG